MEIQLVKRLLKKVIDKFVKNSGTKSKEKNTQSDWEKRKQELLEKARNKSNKNTSPKPNKPQNRNRNNHPKVKDSTNENKKSKPVQKRKPAPLVKKENVNKPDVKDVNWNIEKFKVEPQEGKLRFHDLNLSSEIMHAISDLNFQYCTPIQQEILNSALEGKDAFGKAQTGTGKTAAFLISIVNKLLKDKIEGKRNPGTPRALIIAPTRELVIQISEDAKALNKYTGLSIMSVFGGMDYRKQRGQLTGKIIDIMVATPGRLLDFYDRKDLFLNKVEVLVLDEADRMLDMGFIPDVRKIIRSTPPKEKRQTLFFSATLTSAINRLAAYWTSDAVTVEIEPEQVAVKSVEQKIFIVTNDEKFIVLYNLITQQGLDKVIVFTNRRDETRVLEDLLYRYDVSSAVLSGDVDQRKRIKTLDRIKSGEIKVLVATDVASRGIHIEGISHVINYTLPEDPEDYVHRIGRTGRAGATGIAISFAGEDDAFSIPAIEEFLGEKLDCVYPDEKLLQELPPPVKESKPITKESISHQRNNNNHNRNRNYKGNDRRSNYQRKDQNSNK